VSGPAAVPSGRGPGASQGSARSPAFTGPLLVLVALGLVLRLVLVILLPGSGFANDLASFQGWAANLAAQGPWGFYERPFFHDYTPGYLYVLWLLGYVGQLLGGLGDLVKLPAIVADLVNAWLVALMLRDLGASSRQALGGAALVLFLPITWFDSVVWGQVDSVGVVFVLLGLRALWQDRREWAAVWAVVAAVTKPQLGILAVVVAAVVVGRSLGIPWRRLPSEEWEESEGSAEEVAVALGARPRSTGWLGQLFANPGPIRIVTTATAGVVTAALLALPFKLTLVDLLVVIIRAAGGYPYLTVNAYNPWALVSWNGAGLATNGAWLCDALAPGSGCTDPAAVVTVGPLWAVVVGTGLLLAVVLAVGVLVALRPDPLPILVAFVVLAVAFFVVPTRVHERYLYPFFLAGAVLAVRFPRWRWAYGLLAAANFANLYVVLTTLYPGNPSISDWLGVGSLLRSSPGVTAAAMAHLAGFLWVGLQLRPRSLAALEAEATESAWREAEGGPGVQESGAAEPGLRTAAGPAIVREAVAQPPGTRGGAGPAAANLPPSNAGPLAALWARLTAPPRRPDRSGGLAGESGGRLDRLDLWMLAVIIVAALVSRTFRLDQPFQMHFDEVYHARTATEFLQFWRYGEPHSIYEYTHPHLAKYLIAAGIVAFANDHVAATATIPGPVRDAVVEARWEDPSEPSARSGDRLYVADGSGVTAYDLTSRLPVARLAWPGATAVAIDPVNHRLFVGASDGRIGVLETATALDPLRWGASAGGLAFRPLADARMEVRRLVVPSDGATLVAVGRDAVVGIDAGDGTILGRLSVPDATAVAEAGTAEALVAPAGQVADPVAVARQLAALTGGDAATYRDRLAHHEAQVALLPITDPTLRERLSTAIADGRLAGLEIVSLPRLAAAGRDGLQFFLPALPTELSHLTIAGPVTGLAAVSGVQDNPTLYLAAGREVTVVDLGSAPNATPTIAATIPMPGPVEDVRFNPASELVHVLGETAAGGPTVYVIEPHGNAVFADATLPFRPAVWVADVAPATPAADREQLLLFAPDGEVAALPIGGYAFAWRFPGVIAGALTAALVYLLARILFRRRSVGILAGLFFLVDGMAFVQSRIAMNDVYVSLFITAAYTVLAALWTGALRGRWAPWLIPPVIGLLLGLGLASKWVAAYALGGIGILLLARSALGRIVLVAGFILVTTVLGYIAISVPSGASSGGNYTFLLLMIGLTLLVTVVSVAHPVAWSREETRFILVAPALLGGLLAAAGLVAAAAGISLPGRLPVVPMGVGLVVAGLVLAAVLWAVGRRGVGPLAVPPEPDDPAAHLPPPAPPPPPWLRIGWLAGLPVLWAAVSLLLIPVVVYVVSYLPWVALGNRLTDTWPPGHDGQTLLQLTVAMYDYHNNLRAAHPAASPWWAWPFDLKPVWFYQGAFAGDTAAAIYDAGNLVVWWLGVPAIALAAWQAFRRRSLGLALVVVGFACQWLPWARIDRATFQYHYYTAVPFLVVALGYLAAELWHGPSRATWLVVRLSAALAVVAPPLLWLLRSPLCAVVGVERARPNSEVCVGNPGDLVVTANVAALVLVMAVAVLLLVWQFLHLDRAPGTAGARRPASRLAAMLATAVGTVVALSLVGLLFGDQVVFSFRRFPPELVALLLTVALAGAAWVVLGARDPRRFAAGLVVAAVAWFVVWYPNLAALPLPSTIANAYQGLLPTYVWAFQFPVNLDPPVAPPPLLALPPFLLLVALTVTVLIVAYSTWSWRVALAERELSRAEPSARGTTPIS
jgi:hypothetical protein